LTLGLVGGTSGGGDALALTHLRLCGQTRLLGRLGFAVSARRILFAALALGLFGRQTCSSCVSIGFCFRLRRANLGLDALSLGVRLGFGFGNAPGLGRLGRIASRLFFSIFLCLACLLGLVRSSKYQAKDKK
jgi:hypothetical protein